MLSDEIKNRIEAQIKGDKIVLYMKGTAEQPRCGFSAAVAETLKRHGKSFKTYDILQDQELREGIKIYTNWPTIPQLYVDGKFVGGCDIVMDMDRSGELAKIL